MVRDKTQKTVSYIRRNFRYIFVFFLLTSIYFFGGNYQPEKDQEQMKKYKLVEKNIYRLSPSAEYIEVDNQISTKKDTFYRLSFDAEALPDLDKLRLENGSSLEGYNQISVNVSLRGVLGQKKQIGQIAIPTSNLLVPGEIVFAADDNYRDIIFERSNLKEKSQIDYSNIRISPINCGNVQCIEKLMPTINGKNQKIVQSFSSGKVAEELVKFNRKNQLIGRIIQPDSDQIESVDLAINKIGTGGLGDYKIALFNVEPKKSDWQIRTSAVSTLYFTADDLTEYQIGNSLYRFPLAVKTQKGEKYFLGVSNSEAKFNSLNNLSVLLSDGNYPGGEKITSESLDLINKNIYLVANSVEYASDFESKFLINSKLEDLGSGDGLYSYHFSHSSADFLDIDSIFYNGDNGLVYRDSITDGISIPALSDAGVIYKFDTLYPFSRFFIKISQLSGDFTTGSIYYSYDSSNWEPVSSLEDDQNKFEKILIGDGKNHQVYLKMIPNPNDKNKTIKLFNIQNIDVSAKVKL